MTKERENISNKLNNKASTVQKLMEDNDELSIKLDKAKMEAEQLESISQQIYVPPPAM
jgi:hypothetical protein